MVLVDNPGDARRSLVSLPSSLLITQCFAVSTTILTSSHASHFLEIVISQRPPGSEIGAG